MHGTVTRVPVPCQTICTCKRHHSMHAHGARQPRANTCSTATVDVWSSLVPGVLRAALQCLSSQFFLFLSGRYGDGGTWPPPLIRAEEDADDATPPPFSQDQLAWLQTQFHPGVTPAAATPPAGTGEDGHRYYTHAGAWQATPGSPHPRSRAVKVDAPPPPHRLGYASRTRPRPRVAHSHRGAPAGHTRHLAGSATWPAGKQTQCCGLIMCPHLGIVKGLASSIMYPHPSPGEPLAPMGLGLPTDPATLPVLPTLETITEPATVATAAILAPPRSATIPSTAVVPVLATSGASILSPTTLDSVPIPAKLHSHILDLEFVEMHELLPEAWGIESSQSCCPGSRRQTRRAPVQDILL